MKFPQNKFEIKTIVTKNFFNDVINLMFDEIVIHLSHVNGEIIGYADDFRNTKLKENKILILVFAHNLFSFNFYFIVKGIKFCVWRKKSLNIGGAVCKHWKSN